MNNKDTRKASESIAYPMVSLLDAVDLLFMFNPVRARQIFVSGLSNALILPMGRLYSIFKPIYQKFDTRRMDEIYED